MRYRRVLKIDNGGGNFIYRTVRISTRTTLSSTIVAKFDTLQLTFAKKYNTANIFVDARPGQNIPGYYPQQPGEVWDWVNPP